MGAEHISLLIDSINTLTSRINFLLYLIALVWLSAIGVILYQWLFNNQNYAVSELDNADWLLDQGKYDQLLNTCKSVIKHRPKNVQANWYVALCFYHQGKYTSALKYFEKVNLLDPHWENGSEPYIRKINQIVEQTGANQEHYN